ncbi:ribonuclease H-like domain-containing protein [Tanacetum coccineum]
MQFLMGLDDSYMQIRSSILSREVLPDVRSAYATISKSHRVASGSVSDSSQMNQASAFVSNVSNRGNFQRSQSSNTAPRPNNLNNNRQSGGYEFEKSSGDWLGHPANPVLNVLKNDLQIENKSQTEFCETCQRAKQTREHFPLSDHTSSKLGDLVYLNLWGPYKMPCDDERVDPELNSDHRSQSDSSHSHVLGRDINTVYFSDNISGNNSQNSDDIFAAHDERVTTLEDNINSEGNLDQNLNVSAQGTQNLRRSSRQSVFLRNYNDFIMDSKVKYGLEKKAIGSKWIFKIKYKSSGEIDRYKARLVAQGFGQKERIDYEETFSLVVKCQRKSDYSLFTKSDKGVFRALLVYVDDIIITGNNLFEIEKFKVYVKSKFMIKDLSKLIYFLGIEVIDTNKANDNDPILDNITDYQKLMGKLIYLTNTRPDISYVVRCLSQFMHSSLKSHLKIAFKILRYLKSCPGLGIHITKNSGISLKAFSDADWAKCVVTRRSITGYCVYLNNSLVS